VGYHFVVGEEAINSVWAKILVYEKYREGIFLGNFERGKFYSIKSKVGNKESALGWI